MTAELVFYDTTVEVLFVEMSGKIFYVLKSLVLDLLKFFLSKLLFVVSWC